MTSQFIVAQLPLLPESLLPPKQAENKPNLHTFWQHPERLPACVTASPTAMRCLELLGPLNWAGFPERDLQRNWGQTTIPYATLAAAELVRLNESLPSLGRLRRFLLEHTGFIPLLGGLEQLILITPRCATDAR